MSIRGLTQRDAVALLELVEAVSAAETIDDYATVAMTGLTELIPCVDASYNEMNPAARRVQWRALPDPGRRLADFVPVFQQKMRQNPLIRHFEDTGDTRAMMWSDLTPLEEIRRTELYQEMFRHLGVDSQMALTLPAPPGIIVGFAVNSGTEGFTERDRAVMNTLRPHLAHAYRCIHLRTELAQTRQALRTLGWTGALADSDGTIEAVTDDAVTLGEQSGVVLAEGEPLPGRLRASLTTGVGAYGPSQPAILSRSTRLSDEANGVAGWHVPSPVPPHVVIVQAGIDSNVSRLEQAGLSRRQVQVALQLAEGAPTPRSPNASASPREPCASTSSTSTARSTSPTAPAR